MAPWICINVLVKQTIYNQCMNSNNIYIKISTALSSLSGYKVYCNLTSGYLNIDGKPSLARCDNGMKTYDGVQAADRTSWCHVVAAAAKIVQFTNSSYKKFPDVKYLGTTTRILESFKMSQFVAPVHRTPHNPRPNPWISPRLWYKLYRRSEI